MVDEGGTWLFHGFPVGEGFPARGRGFDHRGDAAFGAQFAEGDEFFEEFGDSLRVSGREVVFLAEIIRQVIQSDVRVFGPGSVEDGRTFAN